MQDADEIIEDWLDWRRAAPMRDAMTFTNAGLGAGARHAFRRA